MRSFVIRTVYNIFRVIKKIKVTRKDYKCVANRVWWGNLSECVHLRAIPADKTIILKHTQIMETYIYIYIYIYRPSRRAV